MGASLDRKEMVTIQAIAISNMLEIDVVTFPRFLTSLRQTITKKGYHEQVKHGFSHRSRRHGQLPSVGEVAGKKMMAEEKIPVICREGGCIFV